VEAAARSLARATTASLHLAGHDGAHPRLGVLDVVPFVALGDTAPSRAVLARDAFCAWAANELSLPCFRYGPLPGGGERTLPEVRRGAFTLFDPDAGPSRPHPKTGAAAVGARPVLVAYNLWLEGATGAVARSLARAVRGPAVRALGFDLPHGVQLSCNLVEPLVVGPAEIYDAVTERLQGTGAAVARCELVGLVPAAVLAQIEPERWSVLDLGIDRTIEARLEAVGVAR
jgi:glutamate formiminotransferase / 5-formyltetrahydrofolate cyclo-ligase